MHREVNARVLAGRMFDFICDININKNGNAFRISRSNSFRLHAFDISTHDGDKFCRFRIPPLFHWSLEQIRGVYIICQPTPETVLGSRANKPFARQILQTRWAWKS